MRTDILLVFCLGAVAVELSSVSSIPNLQQYTYFRSLDRPAPPPRVDSDTRPALSNGTEAMRWAKWLGQQKITRLRIPTQDPETTVPTPASPAAPSGAHPPKGKSPMNPMRGGSMRRTSRRRTAYGQRTG